MAKQLAIIYSAGAHKDLKCLNRKVALRIVLKIQDNARQSDPLSRAKALRGALAGKYRYRIGEYRAIIALDTEGRICILKVLRIKHRKDVYR